MAKLTPLFNQVILVKADVKNEKTASGLYIPPEAAEENLPAVGEIVAIGGGKVAQKAVEKYGLKEGMKVLYSKYSGTEITLEGKEYIIVSIKDLLAILEE